MSLPVSFQKGGTYHTSVHLDLHPCIFDWGRGNAGFFGCFFFLKCISPLTLGVF